MRKMFVIIVLLIMQLYCVSNAESMHPTEAINFMDEARTPYWTFSYSNMLFELATDEEFRDWQNAILPPIYSEESDAMVFWNQNVDYEILTKYNFALIDQTILYPRTLHDSSFSEDNREYTLDLYSVADDYIVVAHDWEIIYCVQYINADDPAIEYGDDAQNESSYYHYRRNQQTSLNGYFTLTAFYTDGSITTVRFDKNTGEIISIANETSSDSLISHFDVGVNSID